MSPQNSFDTWFANQLEKGLVDIKFAISPGKAVSSAAVQDELLQAEASVQAGFAANKAPAPMSELRDSVTDLFKKIVFH